MMSDDNHFDGQQEGERILYVIRPHPMMLQGDFIKIVMITLLFILAWYRSAHIVESYVPGATVLGWLLILGGALGVSAWRIKFARGYRVYVTERRLMAFKPSFPVTYSKRTIFWKNVVKTKTLSDSVLWRLAKVGSLEVMPAQSVEYSLRIPYVYYFEDLANYFDKLVYLTAAEPEQLKIIRPFITKPKGERYGDDGIELGREELVPIDHLEGMAAVGGSPTGGTPTIEYSPPQRRRLLTENSRDA